MILLCIYLTHKLLHQKEIHTTSQPKASSILVKPPQMLFNFMLGMYDFQFRHIRIQDMCLDLWPRHRNCIYIFTSVHYILCNLHFNL